MEVGNMRKLKLLKTFTDVKLGEQKMTNAKQNNPTKFPRSENIYL
jgi:hypothetical protein